MWPSCLPQGEVPYDSELRKISTNSFDMSENGVTLLTSPYTRIICQDPQDQMTRRRRCDCISGRRNFRQGSCVPIPGTRSPGHNLEPVPVEMHWVSCVIIVLDNDLNDVTRCDYIRVDTRTIQSQINCR
jgi:hypothetical protein